MCGWVGGQSVCGPKLGQKLAKPLAKRRAKFPLEILVGICGITAGNGQEAASSRQQARSNRREAKGRRQEARGFAVR